MKSYDLKLSANQSLPELDIKKFYHQSKPAILTVFFHLIIIAVIFSFNKAAIKISSPEVIGSFNLVSANSTIKHGYKKTITQPKNSLGTTDETASNNDTTSQKSNSSSEVIFDAEYLNNPYPQYPLLAKRRGEQGVVLVRAFINQEGLATKIEIAKSSSYSSLDYAAIEAIKKWQFIPAKRFGQNTTSSVLIPINFKLS